MPYSITVENLGEGDDLKLEVVRITLHMTKLLYGFDSLLIRFYVPQPQVTSGYTAKHIVNLAVEAFQLSHSNFKLLLRGFHVQDWRTLGSQEGSNGGFFKIVPI